MKRTAIAIAFFALMSSAGMLVAQDDSDAFQVDVHVVAPVLDADGNQIGMAAVGTNDDELAMVVILEGLTEGDHGIHLHETGNCDPEGENTFSQAGGHFNPGGMTHPNHEGDLGNLVANADGSAMLIVNLGVATFDNGEWGLADADGTALVVHADPDDLATDPSGNSGARIACAVLAPPVA